MLQEDKYVEPEESLGQIINVKELRKIEHHLRTIFNQYQITEKLLPTFEYLERYRKIYSQIPEDKIFQFIGREGKVMVLRWDYTIAISQQYFLQNIEQEAKYSYFGKVYRKIEPYEGKSLEEYQAGIELLHFKEGEGERECLEILQKTLPYLNLPNLKIELGSAKLFHRIEEVVGEKERLVEILSKKNLSAMEEFIKTRNIEETLAKFLLRLPRMCGNIDSIKKAIEEIPDPIMKEAIEELKKIYETMEEKENVIFDLAMCPSMEYYTGLMFHVYSDTAPVPVIKGGRYDSLYGKGKKEIPAIGMGYDLTTIVKAIEKEKEKYD